MRPSHRDKDIIVTYYIDYNGWLGSTEFQDQRKLKIEFLTNPSDYDFSEVTFSIAYWKIMIREINGYGVYDLYILEGEEWTEPGKAIDVEFLTFCIENYYKQREYGFEILKLLKECEIL